MALNSKYYYLLFFYDIRRIIRNQQKKTRLTRILTQEDQYITIYAVKIK